MRLPKGQQHSDFTRIIQRQLPCLLLPYNGTAEIQNQLLWHLGCIYVSRCRNTIQMNPVIVKENMQEHQKTDVSIINKINIWKDWWFNKLRQKQLKLVIGRSVVDFIFFHKIKVFYIEPGLCRWLSYSERLQWKFIQ